MKKLSLLFILSFGLLTQAAQDPEQEFARELGAADTVLEQAEGASLEAENTQEEDTNNPELDSSSPAPKNGSRHTRSFLVGLASGLGCTLVQWQVNSAVLAVRGRILDMYSSGQLSSHECNRASGILFGCGTALDWSITAARLALPAMVLKKLYKEKKDVKYTKATIAKSAALAAVGTSLTWIDLWIKLGL